MSIRFNGIVLPGMVMSVDHQISPPIKEGEDAGNIEYTFSVRYRMTQEQFREMMKANLLPAPVPRAEEHNPVLPPPPPNPWPCYGDGSPMYLEDAVGESHLHLARDLRWREACDKAHEDYQKHLEQASEPEPKPNDPNRRAGELRIIIDNGSRWAISLPKFDLEKITLEWVKQHVMLRWPDKNMVREFKLDMTTTKVEIEQRDKHENWQTVKVL